MKLKMQSFMLLGAKASDVKTEEGLVDALAQEKSNWYPLFKGKVCTGQLQI